LGAGLGAAGLASGFAASHFDGLDEVVSLGEMKVLVEMGWWCAWAWSVETMDEGLLSGGGAVL
jgi:hypothetical protein